MPEKGESASDTSEVDDLLVLAHSRPAEALARSRAVLSGRPQTAAAASVAHQAAGIALRDLGHPGEGLAELRRGLRSARVCGQPQRVADVQASLGMTMVAAGQTTR